MAEKKSTYNLIPQTLKKGLYTQIVGSRILHFKELNSTMDRAAEEAERATPDGTVILCDRQTSGRGRFKRTWVSPAGNLILSVVLRPTLEALPYVSVLAALAVVKAIEKETNLDTVIKWPNDVLIRGRKLCGLLVENSLQGRKVRHSIVGIGLNVDLDPTETPEIAATATSLRLATGQDTDVSALLLRLLLELDELYVALLDGQSPVPQWSRYLETLGKRVQVQWGTDLVTGRAEGVNELGHLLLRRDNGALLTLTAGEVTLKSPGRNPALTHLTSSFPHPPSSFLRKQESTAGRGGTPQPSPTPSSSFLRKQESTAGRGGTPQPSPTPSSSFLRKQESTAGRGGTPQPSPTPSSSFLRKQESTAGRGGTPQPPPTPSSSFLRRQESTAGRGGTPQPPSRGG